MRLIKKIVQANSETFAPELVVTIAIPLTANPDPAEPRKSHEVWGREFLELIGAKREDQS